MKLMEKLKNALFEEEYVEVEEKPVKEKKKKEKRFGKNKNKEIEQIKNKGRQRAQEEIELPKEEKPIVKKVAAPKEKPKPIVKEEKLEELEEFDDFKEDRDELKGNNNFKFQEILEDDFKYEPTRELPKITPQYNNVAKTRPIENKKPQAEKPLYQGGRKEETFGFEKEYNSSHIYESKPPKSTFKPSPIISPIYGLLNPNDKEEEKEKTKEIKLPTFKSEHLDIDEVRNRAYGVPTATDMDMFEMDEEENYDEQNINADDNNDLLDLTDNHETPSVSKVTVGDAEEYFEDLGLEYNKDYIDASKENKTRRRVKEDKEYEEEIKETKQETTQEINEDIEPTKTDDENLFDLIDSMYEKE